MIAFRREGWLTQAWYVLLCEGADDGSRPCERSAMCGEIGEPYCTEGVAIDRWMSCQGRVQSARRLSPDLRLRVEATDQAGKCVLQPGNVVLCTKRPSENNTAEPRIRSGSFTFQLPQWGLTCQILSPGVSRLHIILSYRLHYIHTYLFNAKPCMTIEVNARYAIYRIHGYLVNCSRHSVNGEG